MFNAKWASIMRAGSGEESGRWNSVRLTREDVTTFDWLQHLAVHCAEEQKLRCELRLKEDELAIARLQLDLLRSKLAQHSCNGMNGHEHTTSEDEDKRLIAFGNRLHENSMATSGLLGCHLYCAGDHAVDRSARAYVDMNNEGIPPLFATQLYFSDATATTTNNTHQGNERIMYCKGTQTDFSLASTQTNFNKASASFIVSSEQTSGKTLSIRCEAFDDEATTQCQGHHQQQEACNKRDLLAQIEKLTEKVKMCQNDTEQTQSACRTHMIQHEAKTKDKEQELHRCRRIVGDLRRALNTQSGELKQLQTATDMVINACTKEIDLLISWVAQKAAGNPLLQMDFVVQTLDTYKTRMLAHLRNLATPPPSAPPLPTWLPPVGAPVCPITGSSLSDTHGFRKPPMGSEYFARKPRMPCQMASGARYFRF